MTIFNRIKSNFFSKAYKPCLIWTKPTFSAFFHKFMLKPNRSTHLFTYTFILFLSMSLFPHLQNGGNNYTSLMGLLWELEVNTHKHLGQCLEHSKSSINVNFPFIYSFKHSCVHWAHLLNIYNVPDMVRSLVPWYEVMVRGHKDHTTVLNLHTMEEIESKHNTVWWVLWCCECKL